MPNRILKESITTSETVDSLSVEAERFFYRLIVVCDDYGLMDARPAIIRSRCFPLRVDEITTATVQGWLGELEAADVIRRYVVGGRAYLKMTTFLRHQQQRAKRSKYPEPPDGACQQPISDDIRRSADAQHMSPRARNTNTNTNTNPIRESESEIEHESIAAPNGAEPATKPPRPPRRQEAPEPAYSAEFEAFWRAYPRHIDKFAASQEFEKRRHDGVPAAKLIAAAENYAAYVEREGSEDRHIKHAATFLGTKRAYLTFVDGVPSAEHVPRAPPLANGRGRVSKMALIDTS